METITVNVLLLGPARDFAGVESCEMTLPGSATVAEMGRSLADRFEKLAPALSTVRFAINDEFAANDSVLRDGDEVAVIPPVSGGSGSSVLADLTDDPIDVAQIRAFVGGDPRFGGIVTFEGATRGECDDTHGELLRLNYEAHESMALKQLEKLCVLCLERWGAGKVAVVHRIGSVPVGEVSVMIAVALGHRKEAFEACRWLIDTLKQEVPIWKKDVFEDGFIRWVEGNARERN